MRFEVAVKYQKVIDKIRSGGYSRADLVKLRTNAESARQKGDSEAEVVIDEIDHASPTDKTMVFMGFCPGANFDNRLDIEWRQTNTCTFIFSTVNLNKRSSTTFGRAI